MKKTLIVVAALAGILLTGCTNAQDSIENNNRVVTIDYLGRDLTCILASYDRSATLTCDFVKFYAENVEPFEESTGPAYTPKGN